MNRLLSIKDIEGVISPHDATVKRMLDVRKVVFAGVDAAGIAGHVGGRVESLGLGETWAIVKEAFPGVQFHFIYTEGDDEFPASLRALYSGDRIRDLKGEDLADATIFYVNYMAHYAQRAGKPK